MNEATTIHKNDVNIFPTGVIAPFFVATAAVAAPDLFVDFIKRNRERDFVILFIS